jgi:hypothetical protein
MKRRSPEADRLLRIMPSLTAMSAPTMFRRPTPIIGASLKRQLIRMLDGLDLTRVELESGGHTR